MQTGVTALLNSVLANYSIFEWVVLSCGAVLLGVSRTGIRGFGFLVVPVYAALLGGRQSAGTVLVLILAGDVVAALFYFRQVQWRYMIPLIPGAVAGLFSGAIVGALVSASTYSRIISVIVLTSVALMIVQRRSVRAQPSVSMTAAFPVSFLGGAASMLGNLAGPIFNTYLISTDLSKIHFIGTTAWFFFLLNLSKLPFHLFVWHTVTVEALIFDLILVVPMLVGTALGIWVVRVIPERFFRWLIVILSIGAAVRLLFS